MKLLKITIPVSLGGFCLGEKTSRLKMLYIQGQNLIWTQNKRLFLNQINIFKLYVHKLSVFHFCNDCAHI